MLPMSWRYTPVHWHNTQYRTKNAVYTSRSFMWSAEDVLMGFIKSNAGVFDFCSPQEHDEEGLAFVVRGGSILISEYSLRRK